MVDKEDGTITVVLRVRIREHMLNKVNQTVKSKNKNIMIMKKTNKAIDLKKENTIKLPLIS